MDKEITIFLLEPELKKFKLFQQYYSQFMLLVERGVFNQKNGAVTLHFNKDGILTTIQRADYLYSRQHEK